MGRSATENKTKQNKLFLPLFLGFMFSEILAIFFSLSLFQYAKDVTVHYLFFTADTFTCFAHTYRNNQSDTVVNWLLEQFVTSHVLYEYRSIKS